MAFYSATFHIQTVTYNKKTKINMSGQSGIRGYLLQSIIAVLNSLDDPKWKFITIEPDIGNDKVDILWEYDSSIKVSQVKSSQNQITISMAKTWSNELETNIAADDYELILIGPVNKELSNSTKIGKVNIPIPQFLNLNSLIDQASNQLDKFLESFSVTRLPHFAREVIIESLISKYSGFSTSGTKLSRPDFLQDIRQKILLILPEGINRATEELKLKYNSISRVEEYKFKLKYEACLEALEVVDALYLRSMEKEINEKFPDLKADFPESKMNIIDPLELGEKGRRVHNKLVLSCDSKEIILLYRRCVNMEGTKENMSLIVDLRGAIRRELGFGNDVIDENRDKAWIGMI
ncbi:hypothetical protein G1L02_12650 [Tenacibaculum finnmarkense]|uniref:hypothetical protein n=1 Tax=Tenacibaculum finnmarkense TaxID=2781243 RepID=UPI001EFAEAD8|nr:hypothetical protein [Tenacibaculum finnmarkense]MCG8884001.1 hypothetical protein [Tenacibaculum finnmarkense]